MENLAFETHAFKTSERLEERDLSDGVTLRSIYSEGRPISAAIPKGRDKTTF